MMKMMMKYRMHLVLGDDWGMPKFSGRYKNNR